MGLTTMLARMTTRNRLTLPKNVTRAVGEPTYFEVEAKDGRIILTPVRSQRADAVRTKLAEAGIDELDIARAVAWAGMRTRRARP